MDQRRIENPSGIPTYRWLGKPVDLKDPNTVYRTIEMDNAILIDVDKDGRIIGVENYGGELTLEDFASVLANPNIRFVESNG